MDGELRFSLPSLTSDLGCVLATGNSNHALLQTRSGAQACARTSSESCVV